ncbi:MAG: hypothetical protein ACRDPG_03525 [Nocardioidaceae bacterium]
MRASAVAVPVRQVRAGWKCRYGAAGPGSQGVGYSWMYTTRVSPSTPSWAIASAPASD